MILTKEQFYKARAHAKQIQRDAGCDDGILDWEIQHYPGMVIVRFYFVDGMLISMEMTKYFREYPRKDRNVRGNFSLPDQP